MDDLVQRAAAKNRSLAVAAAALAEAREYTAAQAGAKQPQVALTAGIGRQKYGDQFLGTLPQIPPFTYFSVGPSVSYTLDYTGGIARSIEQQRALAEFQQHQLDAAYLTVTGNTVLLSLQIAALHAQIDTVNAILAQDQDNLRLVQQAYEGGAVSNVDVLSAESQLAKDATLLPPLRQQMSMTQHALAVMLGEPPAVAILPDIKMADLELPKSLPVIVPSELAHQRPDILAAEAQLHAATAAVGVAKANLYPQVSILATGGQQSTTFQQLFDGVKFAWGLAGNLTAPLFNGGTLRAKRRAAIAALQANAANYEQTVLVAFGQVADALEALEHDNELLEAEAHAQESARLNAELARKSFEEGYVGVLQILDAERQHQEARLGYVRAISQRYSDTAQLFLALGGRHQSLP
jgi:NodT family efflux transporter outer membrane factor (OMF) lipoprotein